MPLRAGYRLFGLDECGGSIRMQLTDGLLGNRTIRNLGKEKNLRVGRTDVMNDCKICECHGMGSNVC